MRVVIAGGSGLIGRALTRSLGECGGEVVILSRSPERVDDLPAGATAARWDGESPDALVPLLEESAAVVNLAGENIGAGRWTRERKRRIRDSRTRVTRTVTEALGLAARRPAVLIQASAVGVYGNGGDEILDESRAIGEGFLADVCRDWEAASEGVEAFGVRRVVIRTGVVLAAQGGALQRMLLPFRLGVGGPVGSGNQWFPWIHLRDEVRAIRFALEHDEAVGPFNLTAPNPVTNREMAKILGRVMGRPSFVPTPAWALEILLGEMAALVLEGQRAVPSRLTDLGYEFEFPELEQALRDLI